MVLLILGSLFLTMFAIRMAKKDYANPGFIYLAVWLIASISTALYSLKWGEDLSLITIIIILIGNTSFLIGVLLSSGLISEVNPSKKLTRSQ